MNAHRRGFTLLEVALAAVLGSIVVLAALSMFSSLDNAQKAGEEAFDEALSSAATHDAISRAMQNVMMSNSVPPPRTASGERVRPGQDGAEPPPADAPPDPRDLELPRLILEPDLSQGPIMEDATSQRGGLVHPQRLELALRSRPIFVYGIEREETVEELAALGLLQPAGASDPQPSAGVQDFASAARLGGGGGGASGPNASAAAGLGTGRTTLSGGDGGQGVLSDDRREVQNGRAGRDRRSTPRGAGESATEPRSPSGERAAERADAALGGAAVAVTELVQGVRGAFEFEFDPGVAGGGLEPQAGWVLWWRQIYPSVQPHPTLDPGPGQRVGRTRLMGGIASGTWNVLYTKRAGAGQATEAERLREHSAVWAEDLPSYVELDILSTAGVRHQWTFEIGWGVSGEPGTVASNSGVAVTGPAGAAAREATSPAGRAARAADNARNSRTGTGYQNTAPPTEGPKSQERIRR